MHAFRLLVAATVMASTAPPVPSADLIEPWEQGLSNVELHLASSREEVVPTVTGLIGFGLGAGFSLGIAAERTSDGQAAPGMVVVFSTGMGPRGDVDLWLAAWAPPGEAVDRGWCGSAGLEWSGRGAGAVPYLRVAARREDGTWRAGTVIGAVLRAGPAVDVHLETEVIRTPFDGHELGVAVGPNLRLSPRAELVTELRWSRGAGGASGLGVVVGIVLDPRRLS